MKAVVRTPWGHLEIEGDSLRAIAGKLGTVAELWCHTNCGNCKSENIKPYYRNPSGSEYYGLICSDCQHTLDFHCNRPPSDGMYVVESEGWKPPYRPNDTAGAGTGSAGGHQVPNPADIPF